MREITQSEVDVLRLCAGEAARGVVVAVMDCMERLVSCGLVSRQVLSDGVHYTATTAGYAYLEAMEDDDNDE